MKNLNLKTEWPIWIIALLPSIYLWFVWGNLPDKVPMHWNLAGEVDRYGSKTELIFLSLLLPILVYGLMLIIPAIDPRGKLKQMGSKYQWLKGVLVVFMSAIAIFATISSQSESFAPQSIIILVGLMLAALGNYFKTIKPNYFVGIRTPWTLENDTVWKKTHILGGKITFIGGLVLAASALFIKIQYLHYVMMLSVSVIVMVPVVYSYLLFKKLKKENTQATE